MGRDKKSAGLLIVIHYYAYLALWCTVWKVVRKCSSCDSIRYRVSSRAVTIFTIIPRHSPFPFYLTN
jgi:hypothetical protein